MKYSSQVSLTPDESRSFFDETLTMIGTTIWRTLLPASAVSEEVRKCTQWWFGPPGHVYVSPVDDVSEMNENDQMFEISCRNVIDPTVAIGKRVSWGVPATNKRVQSHFTVSVLVFSLSVGLLTDIYMRRSSTQELKTPWHWSRKVGGRSSLHLQDQD